MYNRYAIRGTRGIRDFDDEALKLNVGGSNPHRSPLSIDFGA
jgi:hypothetical protein